MNSVNPAREKSLKELLDGLLISQRNDIKAYSGGHLNENKLRKHIDPQTHNYWKTSKIKAPSKQKVKATLLLPKEKPLNTNEMQETMVNFSMGTTGIASFPVLERRDIQQRRLSKSKNEMTPDVASESPELFDKSVLIEELKLPEIMLNQSDKSISARFSYLQSLKISSETPPSVSKTAFHPKKQLVMGFQQTVTKRDQFSKLKEFETTVLKKQDAQEKYTLSGINAVQHLEKKLKTELQFLNVHEGTSDLAFCLQRLKVYNSVLDDLIQSSPTFKFLLSEIKQEYDSYITSLLASNILKPRKLNDHVDQLSARGTSNSRILRFECEKVSKLEKQAKGLLDENDQLRKELQTELELSSENEKSDGISDSWEQPRAAPENLHLDLVDQIEELHAAILERLDEMANLRKILKTKYVPSSVCTHLEHCIKETEIEIQKLSSQKEYYEKSIAEMEKDLQETIESADTTEKDAKRVWKRINKVKAIGRESNNANNDSDSEIDEEAKWNWYIS